MLKSTVFLCVPSLSYCDAPNLENLLSEHPLTSLILSEGLILFLTAKHSLNMQVYLVFTL